MIMINVLDTICEAHYRLQEESAASFPVKHTRTRENEDEAKGENIKTILSHL